MVHQTELAAAGLWTRDFRLFFAARITSLLGDFMLPVGITAAVIDAGYGATGVGYALAAQVGPFAVLLVFGGVLSDRFGARRLMVLADAARCVVQAVLAVSFVLGRPELWQILVLLALSGAGGAVFQPGVASLTPLLAADVQRANGFLRVAEAVAVVIGPSIAGVSLAVASPGVVIALNAATFAVSGGCLLLVRSTSDAGSGRGDATFWQDLAEGWQAFRSRTWLWSVIVVFMAWQLLSRGPAMTLGNSIVVLDHGGSVFGMVMAMVGAGSLLGGLAGTRFRPRHPLAVGATTLALSSVAPIFVAAGAPVWVLAVSYAVGGMGVAFWGVLYMTAIQNHVPQQLLGRVHAYDAAGSLVMRPVGQAVAGPLGVVIGPAVALTMAAGAGVLCCVALLVVPAVRRLGPKAEGPACVST